MNLISQPPRHAYDALCLAVAAGALFACLVQAWAGMSAGRGWVQLPVDLVDGLMLVLPISMVAAAAYGMPALWIAQRLRLAGPLPAAVLAMVPGVALMARPPSAADPLSGVILATGVVTGLVFVLLAYPRTTPASAPAAAR